MFRDTSWTRTSMAPRRYPTMPRALQMSVLWLALAGLMLIGASSTPVAEPAIHAPIVNAAAPRAFALVRNPHLHAAGANTPSKHAELGVNSAHRAAVALRHHLWARHWSYHTWAVAHRGLGMVEGIVRDKRGRPVPFAVVLLKWPKGHPFRNFAMRHATQTNARGYFVMFGVRAQRYCVAAHKSKSYGHVQLVVQTGAVSKAQLKI
jgi:hypothetical protein